MMASSPISFQGSTELVEDISCKSNETINQSGDKRPSDQLDSSFTSQKTSDLSFKSAVSLSKSPNDTFATAEFDTAVGEEDLDISFGNSDTWFQSLEYDNGNLTSRRSVIDGDITFSSDTYQDPDLTLAASSDSSIPFNDSDRLTLEQVNLDVVKPTRTPRSKSTPEKALKRKKALAENKPSPSNDCDILPCDTASSANIGEKSCWQLDSSFEEGNLSPIQSVRSNLNSSRRSLTPKRDLRPDKENLSPVLIKRFSSSENILNLVEDTNKAVAASDKSNEISANTNHSPILASKENNIVLKQNTVVENPVVEPTTKENNSDVKNEFLISNQSHSSQSGAISQVCIGSDSISCDISSVGDKVLPKNEECAVLAGVEPPSGELDVEFGALTLDQTEPFQLSRKDENSFKPLSQLDSFPSTPISKSSESGALLDISNVDLRYSFYINSKTGFGQNLSAAKKLDLLFSVDTEGHGDRNTSTSDLDRQLNNILIPIQEVSFDSNEVPNPSEFELSGDSNLPFESFLSVDRKDKGGNISANFNEDLFQLSPRIKAEEPESCEELKASELDTVDPKTTQILTKDASETIGPDPESRVALQSNDKDLASVEVKQVQNQNCILNESRSELADSVVSSEPLEIAPESTLNDVESRLSADESIAALSKDALPSQNESERSEVIETIQEHLRGHSEAEDTVEIKESEIEEEEIGPKQIVKIVLEDIINSTLNRASVEGQVLQQKEGLTSLNTSSESSCAKGAGDKSEIAPSNTIEDRSKLPINITETKETIICGKSEHAEEKPSNTIEDQSKLPINITETKETIICGKSEHAEEKESNPVKVLLNVDVGKDDPDQHCQSSNSLKPEQNAELNLNDKSLIGEETPVSVSFVSDLNKDTSESSIEESNLTVKEKSVLNSDKSSLESEELKISSEKTGSNIEESSVGSEKSVLDSCEKTLKSNVQESNIIEVKSTLEHSEETSEIKIESNTAIEENAAANSSEISELKSAGESKMSSIPKKEWEKEECVENLSLITDSFIEGFTNLDLGSSMTSNNTLPSDVDQDEGGSDGSLVLDHYNNMTEDEMMALFEQPQAKPELNLTCLAGNLDKMTLSSTFNLDMKPDLNTTEAGPMTAADDVQNGELGQMLPDVDITALKRREDDNCDKSVIKNFDPLEDLANSSHVKDLSFFNIPKDVEEEATPMKEHHVGLLIPITPDVQKTPLKRERKSSQDCSLEKGVASTSLEKGVADSKDFLKTLKQQQILSPVQLAINKELARLHKVSMERMSLHEARKNELMKKIEEGKKRKEANLKKLAAKMPYINKLKLEQAKKAELETKCQKVNDEITVLMRSIGDCEKSMREKLNFYQTKKSGLEKEVKELVRERDAAKQHVANLKTSIDDIHLKCDKTEKLIEEMMSKQTRRLNEQKERCNENLTTKSNYSGLLAHVTQRLVTTNDEMGSMIKTHKREMEQLEGLIEQQELKVKNNDLTIKQKQKELLEMKKIYENLLRKLS